ncbi:MAG: ADP-ribosylation factor-like protein [Promethearchaeota archaeon]
MIHKFSNSEEIKLTIAGLDNASKTSFLITLRKKYNFYEHVKQLKPTINVDYSSFDFLNIYCINLWDMGGQAKFGKIYINNPIYFADTNYLFYLIDIQDELRFEESIHYLSDLLDIFRILEYSNEIIICFHKCDPKFKNSNDFSD